MFNEKPIRKVLIVADPSTYTKRYLTTKINEYIEKDEDVFLALNRKTIVFETSNKNTDKCKIIYVREDGSYDWKTIFNLPTCGDVRIYDDIEIVGDIQEVIPIATQLKGMCQGNIMVELRYCNVNFEQQKPIVEILRMYGINVNQILF